MEYIPLNLVLENIPFIRKNNPSYFYLNPYLNDSLVESWATVISNGKMVNNNKSKNMIKYTSLSILFLTFSLSVITGCSEYKIDNQKDAT